METSQIDPWGEDYLNGDDNIPDYNRELEIFNALQQSRAMDDLFGIDSGRGILGDMAADHQLTYNIVSGMHIREALEHQRGTDYLFSDRRNNGFLNDMLTDDLFALDVETGMDIGEAIAKEESWANFRDDIFNR